MRKAGFLRGMKALLIKRLRILALSLVLVFGTFLVLAAFYLFNYFRTSLTQASSGVFLSTESLDVSHDFNLLVFEVESFKDPTATIIAAAVANFKPREGKLVVLGLAPGDTIGNIYGSGKVLLSSLYGLSNLSSINRTSKFSVQKLLALQLGIPIDGVLYTDVPGLEKMSKTANLNGDFLTSGHNFVKDGLAISKIVTMLGSSLKTNLDLKSIFSLGKYLVIDFPKITETFPVSGLSDNLSKYDLLFKAKLASQEILEERQSIIILNGTKSVGLAGNMGRLASNLGLSLLGTFNTPTSELYKNSVLITRNPNSQTTSRLAGIFNIEDVRSAESMSNDTKFSRLLRADFVLIAGSDQIELGK